MTTTIAWRTKPMRAALLVALFALILPWSAAAQEPEPEPTPPIEQTGTPTPMPEPTPAPAPTPVPTPPPGCQEDFDDAEQRDGTTLEDQLIEQWQYSGAGDGPRNIVKLHNRRSGQLRVRGNVQLNRIRTDTVDPFNYAIAYNTCGEAISTLSVALQVNLYLENASQVKPENYGFAVNYGCPGCAAFAYAVQFAYPVADPMAIPSDVWDLVLQLDRELYDIHSEQHRLTLGQAHTRVKAVVDTFKARIPGQFQEVEHQSTPTA